MIRDDGADVIQGVFTIPLPGPAILGETIDWHGSSWAGAPWRAYGRVVGIYPDGPTSIVLDLAAP